MRRNRAISLPLDENFISALSQSIDHQTTFMTKEEIKKQVNPG